MLSALKRLVFVLLLAATASAHASSGKYQDWWWDPAKSGMGFNIGHQENTLFVMWFLYGDDGKATFLQLAGNLSGDQLSGTLYRTAGPAPGPAYNPAGVSVSAVGSASISFSSSNAAVFTYSFEGKSGSIALQRYTFANIDLTGTRPYAATGTLSSCRSTANNGSYDTAGIFYATRSGSNYSFTQQSLDGITCNYTLPLSQKGSILSGSGNFTCSGGLAGTIEISDVRKVDDFVNLEYTLRYNTGETCVDRGKLAAAD